MSKPPSALAALNVLVSNLWPRLTTERAVEVREAFERVEEELRGLRAYESNAHFHLNTRGCDGPPSSELLAAIQQAANLIAEANPTHCDKCGALITRDGFVARSKIDPMLCVECADDIHGEDE